jgi:hypothetical protein
MMRNVILCALASAAMIPGLAAAHPGGGNGGGGGGGGEGRGGLMGGGGGGSGMDAGSRGMGGLGGIGDVGMRGGRSAQSNDIGVENREASRINSQALQHASQTGIDHANQNSVLAGTTATRTVMSGTLSGLTSGMTLFSNGTAVGTVQQIRTRGNGSVAVVLVQGTNGGVYAVPASKLSLNGGTLTTTSRFNGINASSNLAMSSQARQYSQGPAHASATGIAHANSHSVLYGATTTTASTGVTTTSTGTNRRLYSQGPAHASAIGIAHANPHSVLAGTAPSTLTGVSVGMPLFSNGTQVGTVTRVVTANGVITRVLVQGTNGRTYSLSPTTLTASGGSLTTSTSLHGL